MTMNNRITKTLRGKAGFTLVELIVVIAILGILAGVGTVGYSGYIKKANEAADNMLLSAVNQAFAAACLENGTDVQNITDADLNLDGAKKVDSVSLYDDDFQKYYAGNENSAFRVFTTIVFDAAKHAFVDAISAGYKAFDLGGGKVYIAPEDAEKLKDSTFITASGLGVEKLMNKVNDVTEFAAALDSDMLSTVIQSDKFKTYMMAAMGIPSTGDPEQDANNLNNSSTGLIVQMMQAYPETYPNTEEGFEKAYNQLQANLAVMYSASNAANMSQQEVSALLTSGSAKNTITGNLNTDTGKAMSQAALAYGMYTAYAYNSGNSELINATNNPVTIVSVMDTDQAFKDYISSEQGQKDLQGYLSALNMINSSTGDSHAVSHVLVNGFNDESLKALISQAVG